MRVLLIGNYPPDKQESMLRFAAMMARELAARGHTVTVLQPQPFFGRVSWLGQSARKWLGYLDKFILFPLKLVAVRSKYEVIHVCDHSNAMYVPRLKGQAHLVTCHDLLAVKGALGETPDNVVSRTGRFFQQLILSGLKQAQHVICVSHATREDLLRLTQLSETRAQVIYQGLNYPFTPMPSAEAKERLSALQLDPKQPFFLHVGSDAWYKNRRGVVELFALLRQRPAFSRHSLLFFGKPLEPSLQHFIEEHSLAEAVQVRSDVASEDLRAAYTLAQAFLFPSLEEGFGWPLLEAQACGCPTFATGRPPMTEIGKEAAVYFDPADLPGAAAIIATGLEDTSLPARGLANAATFSLDSMIESYTQAYEEVRRERSRPTRGN